MKIAFFNSFLYYLHMKLHIKITYLPPLQYEDDSQSYLQVLTLYYLHMKLHMKSTYSYRQVLTRLNQRNAWFTIQKLICYFRNTIPGLIYNFRDNNSEWCKL